MGKKRVLVLSFSELDRDPRVYRQLLWLKSQPLDLTTVGFSPPNDMPDVKHYSVSRPPSPFIKKVVRANAYYWGRYEQMYWSQSPVQQTLNALEKLPAFDLLIANDIDTLPLALKVAQGAKVLYDAHEYAPGEHEDRWLWKTFIQGYQTYLCQKYMPQADAVTTVCEGIARQYEEDFGVHCEVLWNAPKYQDLTPRPLTDERVRMIYQGVAFPGRHVEDAIEVFRQLDERFSLDLILVPGDPSYIEHIQKLAQGQSSIQFVNPVPMPQIPQFCNGYDIGLFPLRPSNQNSRFALPNKFFEFVQARIGIAIYPLPEMLKLAHGRGFVCAPTECTPRALAKQLNSLSSQDIWTMKQRAHEAANHLCAEKGLHLLEKLIQSLVKDPKNPERGATFCD